MYVTPVQYIEQSMKSRMYHRRDRMSQKIASRKQLKILFPNKLYFQGN